MPSLGMGKTHYKLDTETIDSNVVSNTPGNYALGKVSEKGTFIVYYVGRSDEDLNGRLKEWVGKKTKYKYFKFKYALSPDEAFEQECKNYHDFGGSEKLDNEVHPKRPEGSYRRCPYCNLY